MATWHLGSFSLSLFYKSPRQLKNHCQTVPKKKKKKWSFMILCFNFIFFLWNFQFSTYFSCIFTYLFFIWLKKIVCICRPLSFFFLHALNELKFSWGNKKFLFFFLYKEARKREKRKKKEWRMAIITTL